MKSKLGCKIDDSVNESSLGQITFVPESKYCDVTDITYYTGRGKFMLDGKEVESFNNLFDGDELG